MNFRLKRFLENTLPSFILYGLLLVVVTKFVSLSMAITVIVIFSIIDILMLSKRDMIPQNIQYNGKYFSTLTQLIDYVKKGGL